jgi:hypothetical protein
LLVVAPIGSLQHHMASTSRTGKALILIAAVAVAAGVVGAVLLTRGERTISAPPSPSAAASPPAPSPMPVPQPERFRVRLVATKVDAMGNGYIFRRRPGNSHRGAGRSARRVVAELNRYLNAAFVNPITRFTDAPVERLLTGQAEERLDPADRRALGVGAPLIDGGQTGDAVARARVLYDGRRAYAVTVSYRAAMQVALAESDGELRPIRQRGVLVFVPTRAGWRADMVDVQLRLPDAPEAPAPTPSATPGGTPSSTPSPQEEVS